MKLLLGRDREVGEWVSANLNTPIIPPYIAFGIIDSQDRWRGGIVLNGYNLANIELTVYAPGAANRQIIRFVFDYLFRQLGCLRLTARTKRSNAVARKAIPRLGFEYEATLKNYFGSGKENDALVFRMTPDMARKWL